MKYLHEAGHSPHLGSSRGPAVPGSWTWTKHGWLGRSRVGVQGWGCPWLGRGEVPSHPVPAGVSQPGGSSAFAQRAPGAGSPVRILLLPWLPAGHSHLILH